MAYHATKQPRQLFAVVTAFLFAIALEVILLPSHSCAEPLSNFENDSFEYDSPDHSRIDEIRRFLVEQQRRAEQNDLDAIAELYDDEVHYYDRGPLSRENVMRDKSFYLRRWPIRHYQLLPG